MLTSCSNQQLTLNTRFPLFWGSEVAKHLEQSEGSKQNSTGPEFDFWLSVMFLPLVPSFNYGMETGH